jgi:hypothetical protein
MRNKLWLPGVQLRAFQRNGVCSSVACWVVERALLTVLLWSHQLCRGFNNGGIGIIEMLFRCNILAIVGGGAASTYPPNKVGILQHTRVSMLNRSIAHLRGLRVQVMIWDDHAGRCIGELSFRSQVCGVCCAFSVPQSPYSGSIAMQVRAVRLRRDRIVVSLEHKVLVYNFADLKLLSQIETLSNEKGLISISEQTRALFWDDTPGLHTGEVANTPFKCTASCLLSCSLRCSGARGALRPAANQVHLGPQRVTCQHLPLDRWQAASNSI